MLARALLAIALAAAPAACGDRAVPSPVEAAASDTEVASIDDIEDVEDADSEVVESPADVNVPDARVDDSDGTTRDVRPVSEDSRTLEVVVSSDAPDLDGSDPGDDIDATVDGWAPEDDGDTPIDGWDATELDDPDDLPPDTSSDEDVAPDVPGDDSTDTALVVEVKDDATDVDADVDEAAPVPDVVDNDGSVTSDVTEDAAAVTPCFYWDQPMAPALVDAGGTCGLSPCVRWQRTTWIGYVAADLPTVYTKNDADPNVHRPIRAPIAPAVTFQGSALVDARAVGCKFADWSFPLIWEVGPDGADTGYPQVEYDYPSPANCLMVPSEKHYAYAYGGGAIDIFEVSSSKVQWEPKPYGGLRLGTCPTADAAGWLQITDPGGVSRFRWWPLKFPQTYPPTCSYESSGNSIDRTLVTATDGLVFGADEGSGLYLFELDCPGGYGLLNSGALDGNILGDLAPTTTGDVVTGTDQNVLQGTGGFYFKETEFPGTFAASPVIGEDDTIFVGNTNGRMYAVSFGGSLVWSTATGAEILSGATLSANGLLYVANEAPSLVALDQATGAIQWVFDLPGRPAQDSYPLTSDGILYVTAGTELLAVQVEPGGLLNSIWPKTHRDNHNRGNVDLDFDVPQPLDPAE